jgi:hypothetical protein
MTVLRNDDRWDRSNVEFVDGRLVEYNKREVRPAMRFIDYGLSVLRASVIAGYPPGAAFDLADVFHRLSLAGQLAGFEVHDRFFEIGSHQGLQETHDHLSAPQKP